LGATLDTPARKLFLPGDSPRQVVLPDPGGFIRHLPHGLVAAFRSTLEETAQADLLLHVVDVNSAERNDQVTEVNKVLAEVGAQPIPQIVLYNKIDLQGMAADVRRDEYGNIAAIQLSAKTGEGIDLLRDALAAVRDAPPSKNAAEEWHPLNEH